MLTAMTFFDNGQRPWFKISKQNIAWLGVSMLSLFDVCFSKRAVQTICHCNKLHEDTEKSSVWFSCQKTPNLFCLLISSLCFCCTRFKHKAGMFKKKKKKVLIIGKLVWAREKQIRKGTEFTKCSDSHLHGCSRVSKAS